jgi:hypothetical protein
LSFFLFLLLNIISSGDSPGAPNRVKQRSALFAPTPDYKIRSKSVGGFVHTEEYTSRACASLGCCVGSFTLLRPTCRECRHLV